MSRQNVRSTLTKGGRVHKVSVMANGTAYALCGYIGLEHISEATHDEVTCKACIKGGVREVDYQAEPPGFGFALVVSVACLFALWWVL